MTRERKQALAAALITLGVVAADQAIKVAVKTGMYMYQSIRVTDWFYIHFTENNGMAFGMEFLNKYLLTSFRICMVPVIGYYIAKVIRGRAPWGFVVCLALILAGAIGNIVDCVFYGLMFNNPPAPFVADFVPFGHGYAPVMLGRVVDMFYFPLVEWDWPEWMPFLCGHFVFFSPVFNFADAAISCGIIALIVFYRKRISR